MKVVNDGTEQKTIVVDIQKKIVLSPGEERELDPDTTAVHLK